MNKITIKKKIPSDILKEKKMVKITIKREIPSDISKRKKMKKITRCSSVNAKEIHADIAFEVLTRLPIKALDRFKCVSTSWSSMIRQHEFMKAHRPCGGILIHLLPDYSRLKGLYYASLNGKNEVFAHRVRLPYFGYKDITPVINGLACLYTGHQVSLFNISTLELMELPTSSLRGEGLSVWYALGFDTVDNLYKLLKVSSTVANRLVYKILTLETSSRSAWRWREIAQEGLPWFSTVADQSYFVNGTIYCKFRTPNFHENGEQYLLAFDVHQEHFTIFNLPRVPSHIFSIFKRSFILFGQFEGRLAVARVKKTQFETVLELWALEDDQNSIWSKHNIDLPDELLRYFHKVKPIGNLSSGELLLCGSSDYRQTNPFYVYDPVNKKFTELMIEHPNSLDSIGLCSTHITCLMEKITPLNDLVGLRKNV
ncbi:F-box protein At4g19940-like [Lycium ferocissimum]|uniref:F-box protein At4g19940-like n=1 Tax=Lycium ferocissimum TaxID=112874 RepID=UPI00281625D1|nr:F-box protein At4g19940-like [Lycium ferocissimum]